MAGHLGLPVWESMRRHTHRHHKMTVEWLRRQWNNPDRHDHYLMQVAHLLLAVNGGKSKMDDCKLKFEWNRERQRQAMTKEEYSRMAQSVWSARIGMGRKKPKTTPTTTPLPPGKSLSRLRKR